MEVLIGNSLPSIMHRSHDRLFTRKFEIKSEKGDSMNAVANYTCTKRCRCCKEYDNDEIKFKKFEGWTQKWNARIVHSY
jgi:hypothetical protein